MSKTNFVRWAGMVGAIATGVSTITAGDLVTGFGLIAAALSSVSIFKKEE